MRRTGFRGLGAFAAGLLLASRAGRAEAETAPPPPQSAASATPAPSDGRGDVGELDPQAALNWNASSPDAKPKEADTPGPLAEAPPSLPRHHGFVTESMLGVINPTGQMRHYSAAAPWLRTQFGFEPFNWLMVFAQGELAFADTSVATDPTKTRAFPIFGFGAGARFTGHVTERVALYLQGDLGLAKADVASNALGNLGFADAEKLKLSYTGRFGVEWYQVDRHLALGVSGGAHVWSGFSKVTASSDLPLFWDAAGSFRYTF